MFKEFFSVASSIVKIGKDAPPPVYVFFMPPMPQLVPPGVVKKAYANETFRMSVTGIENFSSRVLTNIRIKLTADPAYPPQIMGSDARRLPKFSFDQQRNEIQVESLDPEEKVYFGLFYKEDKSSEVREPIVIIGDRKISRAMHLLGFAKRYPLPAFSIFLGYFTIAVVIVGFGIALLLPEYIAPDKVLLEKAAKDFGTCRVVVLDKEEVGTGRLEDSKLGLNTLLELNEVSSKQELLAKDKVLSCE